MSRIITIAGPRGGTGKSVTAVNLAASLALLERTTLLVDCDPLGSATQWSGVRNTEPGKDIAGVLSGNFTIEDAAVQVEPSCLKVLPSGFDLFRTALRLRTDPANAGSLRRVLRETTVGFDYIIIDAPSSCGFLSTMAMAAADWLVVCMSVRRNIPGDFHSLLRMVKHIRTAHQIPLKIAGIAFNRSQDRSDIRSFLDRQVLSDLNRLIFQTIIPSDDRVGTSMNMNRPAALNDVKGPAAAAYLRLAQEIHSFLN